VLGFILASLLFTFGTNPARRQRSERRQRHRGDERLGLLPGFVSMGLELSFKEFKKMVWSPVVVFLIVTVFNTLLALVVSWIIFGWLFPPVL